MSDEKYILIERYLKGELSSEELQDFEKRLDEDKDFAETVALYKSLSSHLSERFESEEGEKALRETIKSAMNEGKVIPLKERRTAKIPKYLWIAASIVILLGIGVVNNFLATPSYEDFAVHETLSLTERGDDSENYRRAEEAFNTKNYREAAALLGAILAEDSNQAEVALFRAIALVETDQFDEADKMLETLSKSGTAFEDLPDDWVCPDCGADKEEFSVHQ